MKPIEAGCIALIISVRVPYNYHNIGKKVHVIEPARPGMVFTAASGNQARIILPNFYKSDLKDAWVVERPTADLLWCFTGCVNPDDVYTHVATSEFRLMRLDDPDLLIDETHDTELPINA